MIVEGKENICMNNIELMKWRYSSIEEWEWCVKSSLPFIYLIMCVCVFSVVIVTGGKKYSGWFIKSPGFQAFTNLVANVERNRNRVGRMAEWSKALKEGNNNNKITLHLSQHQLISSILHLLNLQKSCQTSFTMKMTRNL